VQVNCVKEGVADMLLIEVLRTAGWPESELGNALGVVQHESGGDPNAHNPGTPSVPEDSLGLFQINRMAHTQYSVAQLCDPVFNATVAYGLFVSAGRTWQDWVYSATALGIAPYGSAQHSISEFQALANLEVGGGAVLPGILPDTGSMLKIALAALGVYLVLDFLTDM
jgi:hypothetical protein